MVYDFTCSSIYAGDNRQAAGHRLDNGQTIGILKRRTRVGVRSGVEFHHVFRRSQKSYPIKKSELTHCCLEGPRVVFSDYEKLYGQIPTLIQRLDQSQQPLIPPVIANQQERKCLRNEVQISPST